MLHSLDLYSIVQKRMKEHTERIYKYYKSGEFEIFNSEVEKVTRSLNSNKITRKQKAKTNCVINTLNMLTTLDEDYCKYIVNKFLSKDEFVELSKNKGVLSI